MAQRTGRFQFQGLFKNVYTYVGTLDVASLVDGAGATSTFTVTGAALGDFVEFAMDVSVAGITVTSWVSAADTVSVRFQNESGGTLDLAAANVRILVKNPSDQFFVP
jgi:hypothetical protein